VREEGFPYPRVLSEYSDAAASMNVLGMMHVFPEIRDLFYTVLDSGKIKFPDVQPGGTFEPDGPPRPTTGPLAAKNVAQAPAQAPVAQPLFSASAVEGE
jgi:hypothetical protein